MSKPRFFKSFHGQAVSRLELGPAAPPPFHRGSVKCAVEGCREMVFVTWGRNRAWKRCILHSPNGPAIQSAIAKRKEYIAEVIRRTS